MNENTKKLIQSIPGLAIQIQVQKKTYSFTHGEVKTKRNYTLGGLYADDNPAPQTKSEVTTASAVSEGVWDNNPTPEMRNHLGDALLVLPETLGRAGVTVLDRQLQTFHNKAKQFKAMILAKYPVGTVIPPTVMKQVEDRMQPYNLNGYTLKVTAIRVTSSNPKNSRKRSDGLYETRQVLRTVFIDRLLNKDELTSILKMIVEAVSKPVLTEVSMTGGYKVSYNQNGGLMFTPHTQTSFKYDGKEMEKSNNFGLPPGVKSSNTRR